MTIGVDIDGVLRDFCGSLISKYAEVYPDHCILNITEWGLDKFFPIGKEIYKFAFSDHYDEIFSEAPVFCDMVDAVNTLSHMGHKIHIITSQPRGKENVSLVWLDKVGVRFDWITFTNNKGAIRCTTYLDDATHNLREIFLAQRPEADMIVRDQPWNRDLNPFIAPHRVSTGLELLEAMKKVEEKWRSTMAQKGISV